MAASLKTETMMVLRSLTSHPQSHPVATISRTVLKEFDDLYILGVTFDSMMTFKKHEHLHSVSRAASQRLVILKYWLVFHDRLLLGRCFRDFDLPVWSTFLQCGALLSIHTLNCWIV